MIFAADQTGQAGSIPSQVSIKEKNHTYGKPLFITFFVRAILFCFLFIKLLGFDKHNTIFFPIVAFIQFLSF